MMSSFSLSSTLLLVAVLIACASAATVVPEGSESFSGYVVQRSVAGKPVGTVLTGTKIDYSYEAKKMAIVYGDLNPAQTEYRDYEKHSVNRVCAGGACDGFALAGNMPVLTSKVGNAGAAVAYKTTTPGRFFSGEGKTCTEFTAAEDNGNTGGVTKVALYGKYPCYAVFANDERWEFDFPAAADDSTPPPAVTASLTTNNDKCPDQPKCATGLDLTFVIDESGSINNEEWNDMRNFVKAVVDALTVANDRTMLGLAYFSGVTYTNAQNPTECCGRAEKVMPELSGDVTAFKAFLDGHDPLGGHTCMGCGIRKGAEYYPNPTRPARPGVMVLLTDGFNNREQNFLAADVANARDFTNGDDGIKILAVGVKHFDEEQLVDIAGEDNVYTTASFDKLVEDVLPALITAICEVNPDPEPCDAAACGGVCGCGGTCQCPDTCDDQDKCTKEECVEATKACGAAAPTQCEEPENKCMLAQCDPASGDCVTVEKNCDDGLACTTDACDAATGQCTNIQKVCPGGDACNPKRCEPDTGECVDDVGVTCPVDPDDACKEPRCDPEQGCVYFDKVCDDGKACTTDQCVEGECVFTPVACGEGNKCVTAECTEPGGCVLTPVGCNDGNVCTDEVCDPAEGCKVTGERDCNDNNPCTDDRCDPVNGCQNVPKDCDDNNDCTTDACNKETGECENTAVECGPGPEPENKCREGRCLPEVGCVWELRTCDDGNFCTTDVCNPETGDCGRQPVVCDDGNKCTDDVCSEEVQACVFTPKVCVTDGDFDPCSTMKCVDGNCVAEATVCDDGNSCTTDMCVRDVGCVHIVVDCNDGDPCTEDRCDPDQPVADQCVNTPINDVDCEVCKDQCPNDPCNPTKCVPDGDGVKCEPLEPFQCDTTGNLCIGFTTEVQGDKCVCVEDDAKAVVCPPSDDLCSPQACDPATGLCTLTQPILCDDGDACFDTKCVVEEGAPVCKASNPTLCGAANGEAVSPCKRRTCDKNTGVCIDDATNPVSLNCDDGNKCTKDQCVADAEDPTKAVCDFTQPSDEATQCTSTDLCVPKECQPMTGECVEKPVVATCPASADLCQAAACDPTTGKCQYVAKDPTCFDGVCEFGKCNPATGVCDRGPIVCEADAGKCQENARCEAVAGEDGKQVGRCVTDNACQADDPCNPKMCDQDGQCVDAPVVCDDNNACTVDECKVEDGKAVCVVTGQALQCDDNLACTNNECVDVDGVATCQFPTNAVLCSSNNLCTTVTCVDDATITEGYRCDVGAAVECPASENKCVTVSCNPLNGECETNDISATLCDDQQPCTVDSCDPATGACTHVERTCDEAKRGCSDARCNLLTGVCETFAINCTANATVVAAIPDACHYAFCANNSACAILPIPGTINACNECNGPAACELDASDSGATAVAGGVIAGAVVAGACALGLGAFAARKAGVVGGASTAAPVTSAVHNPLFEQDVNARDNPFYSPDQAESGYVPLATV